jgi:16S rRNA (guanine(966)-N(2))-methyltransferase RsmD
MNIIQEEVKNSIFLDGFAGTGSVGIEALSRGAKFVVFVDEYHTAVKTIHQNLERCGAEHLGRVVRKEFNRAVIQLARENMKFDLIVLDPPYALLEKRNPLKVIKKRDVLKEKGTIVLRHHYKADFESKYYHVLRQTKIGDDTLSFYRGKNTLS